ncbi:MAG: hypothetical protein WBP64_20780 [Nitrososphaeraceae archaeon]
MSEEDLGGILDFGPAACSWSPNGIDVFYQGLDSSLRHIAWNGQYWTSVQDLGGILEFGPAACSWGYNRIDIFYAGDRVLWPLRSTDYDNIL